MVVLFANRQLADRQREWLGHTSLTALVGIGCFAAWSRTRNRPVLAVGVIALALAPPGAVNDWTHGPVGGADALLAAGLCPSHLCGRFC